MYPKSYADNGNKTRVKRPKRGSVFFKIIVVILCILILLATANIALPQLNRYLWHPKLFSEYVDKFSDEYGVEDAVVYAFIKVESNFNESARSKAGAIGLMQMTEETFEWVKWKMNDERPVKFDDLYTPSYSIQYGTYLISTLSQEYVGDLRTIAAAYHSGRTQVNRWLSEEQYATNGNLLTTTPSRVTNHYMSKIERAYKKYRVNKN